MSNSLKLMIAALLIGLLPESIDAQTVVLVNGVPTTVEIVDQEIVKVKGNAAGYMNGFSNEDDGFTHAKLSVEKKNTSPDPIELAKAGSNQAIVTTSMAKSSPIVTGQKFYFEGLDSTLDKSVVKELKKKAADIAAGFASTIMLETTYIGTDPENKELMNTRLQLCKATLVRNGVDESKVTTILRPAAKASNEVSIILR